jgi:AcrR family transcriptional regulator
MTREQSRANTRERLLAAARSVFARSGFHGASVEEIASEAGFSTGALYSNFEGKEELFLAIFDEHLAWARRTFGDANPEAGTVPDDWVRQFLVFVEFWAYAVRNQQAKDELTPRMAELRQLCSAALERIADARGKELSMPPDTLAIAVMALVRGMAIERLADPGAVSPELEAALLEQLLFAG